MVSEGATAPSGPGGGHGPLSNWPATSPASPDALLQGTRAAAPGGYPPRLLAQPSRGGRRQGLERGGDSYGGPRSQRCWGKRPRLPGSTPAARAPQTQLLHVPCVSAPRTRAPHASEHQRQERVARLHPAPLQARPPCGKQARPRPARREPGYRGRRSHAYRLYRAYPLERGLPRRTTCAPERHQLNRRTADKAPRPKEHCNATCNNLEARIPIPSNVTWDPKWERERRRSSSHPASVRCGDTNR